MRTADYCRCGASLTLRAPKADAIALEAAREAFWAAHHGEGHGPCDGTTAFFARLYGEAGSKVDPLASHQSLRRLAYRPNPGRRVPPKPAAE